MRHSVSKNSVTLKTRLGVVHGHWKWRRSIDYNIVYRTAPFSILCDFLLVGHRMVKKTYDNTLSRFHTIPERNGRTDLLYQYHASVCWRAIKIILPYRIVSYSFIAPFCLLWKRRYGNVYNGCRTRPKVAAKESNDRVRCYTCLVSLWKQRNAFVAGSITSDSAKALSRFKGWASGKWRVGKSEREVCGRAMRRLRIQHIWGWMTLMKELVAVDFNSYTARLLAVMRNNDRPATITAVIAVSLM